MRGILHGGGGGGNKASNDSTAMASTEQDLKQWTNEQINDSNNKNKR